MKSKIPTQMKIRLPMMFIWTVKWSQSPDQSLNLELEISIVWALNHLGKAKWHRETTTSIFIDSSRKQSNYKRRKVKT
jgi:hypothetical protein